MRRSVGIINIHLIGVHFSECETHQFNRQHKSTHTYIHFGAFLLWARAPLILIYNIAHGMCSKCILPCVVSLLNSHYFKPADSNAASNAAKATLFESFFILDFNSKFRVVIFSLRNTNLFFLLDTFRCHSNEWTHAPFFLSVNEQTCNKMRKSKRKKKKRICWRLY